MNTLSAQFYNSFTPSLSVTEESELYVSGWYYQCLPRFNLAFSIFFTKAPKPTILNRLACIVVLWLLAVAQLTAQPEARISLSNSLTGASRHLPFWMWANHDGLTHPAASWLNLTTLSVDAGMIAGSDQSVNLRTGATVAAGVNNNSYAQVNRLFAAISGKNWQFEAGMFYDSLRFDGLSTSNGNIAHSRNARPWPKIRISTAGFRPLPFTRNRFSFSACYDEGLLDDNRYVRNTHIHHKSFYLQSRPGNGWTLQTGIEHFVMWGGISPDENIGEMPKNLRAYLRYITTSKGNENFPETDRLNVAGNQSGTWQFFLSKETGKGIAEFHISHPFEDYSGFVWRNWPDNLTGISIRSKNRNARLTRILYEFTHTAHQGHSGGLTRWNPVTQTMERQEFDNYYNHGIYRSGATYHGLAWVSPLFVPEFSNNGISKGFASNRFRAHHIGACGNVAENIVWKSMFTLASHRGTHAQPFVKSQKQYSALVAVQYNGPKIPFMVDISVAADHGSFTGKTSAARIALTKKW